MTEEGIDLISTHCLAPGQSHEQLRELWPSLCFPDQVSKGRQVQRCFLKKSALKSVAARFLVDPGSHCTSPRRVMG